MGCPLPFTRRSLLAGLSLLPALRILRGQDPKPTFTTDVKVVNIFANVRDKKGAVVKGLTKDDFLLEEDDRPQTIRYFSQESDLPLTLGILVDTSGSTRNVLPDERDASLRFLEQVLRSKDQAFVIHFDTEVELLEDLTSSKQRLERALSKLETPEMRLQRGGFGVPRSRYPQRGGRGQGAGGTALFDAVFLAADEVLKPQTGRKAIILFSDGEDNGSKVEQSTAGEASQRSDTLVYSILFEDQGGAFSMNRGWGGFGRTDGRRVMDRMSRSTGGRFFEVTRKLPLTSIFAEIEEDLRNQYSLGYTPDSPVVGGFRRVKLTTRQKGLTVQTREGYYAT
jgi:VWFA-related protein